MFKIHMGKVRDRDGTIITADAMTLARALGFIGEFYKGQLFQSWAERDGRYVMEVFDWIDFWFDDPPVRARVKAPRGFKPPEGSTRALTRVDLPTTSRVSAVNPGRHVRGRSIRKKS